MFRPLPAVVLSMLNGSGTSGKNVPEGEGVPDVEEEEPPQKDEDEVINEQIFTFDQFEHVRLC